MAYTKTNFHKKVVNSANGMNNSFYLYMINNEKLSYNYNIARLFNYFIMANNILHRRGSKKQKIKDILDFVNSKKTYNEIFNIFKNLKRTTKSENYMDDYAFEQCLIVLFECQNITEDTFDYIVTKVNIIINYLDSIHFDWVVEGNIIYDRNPYTRTIRTYSLTINNNDDFEVFKETYKKMICVDDVLFDKLIEQCFDFYSTLEIIVNSIVNNDYDDAYETLESYLQNSKDMKEFEDIYVRANYMKLLTIKEYLKSGYYTKANQELRKIIESENYKFRKHKFELFKLLQANMETDHYQISLNVAKEKFYKETNLLREKLKQYPTSCSPCDPARDLSDDEIEKNVRNFINEFANDSDLSIEEKEELVNLFNSIK